VILTSGKRQWPDEHLMKIIAAVIVLIGAILGCTVGVRLIVALSTASILLAVILGVFKSSDQFANGLICVVALQGGYFLGMAIQTLFLTFDRGGRRRD
jgi:hypothetical protein